jgi:hypothetical protein
MPSQRPSRAPGEAQSADRRRGRRGPAELSLQIALMVAAALFYFAVRGLTEGDVSEAVARGDAVLRFEQALGIAIERSLQNAVLGSEVLTTLSNWVYIWLHWPVIALTLVWLHRSHRHGYVLLRNAMFVSGAIGLVIFALFPVAPPRHLPDQFVDTVTELSRSYRVLQPPQLINEYAAVPSLHVGWNLLIGIFLVRYSRRAAVRVFGVISPVLMAVAVVTTANHYVIDGVLGSVVALVGLAGSHWLWRIAYAGRSEVGEQAEVVDDEPAHSPTCQLLDALPARERPCEYRTARAEVGGGPLREQAFVHDGAVDAGRQR